MTCTRCRKTFEGEEPKCPYCGKPRPNEGSGVFQSSTVLISAEGTEMVYRSMDEVPDPLRTKLLKSTNSANSATILIADRRGRREIAKAMRSLPGTHPGAPEWLTPNRKKAILAGITMLVLALIALLFLHH